jgi:hypothetical protein
LFFADNHMLRLDGIETHMVFFWKTWHAIDWLLVDDGDEGAVRKDVVLVLKNLWK